MRRPVLAAAALALGLLAPAVRADEAPAPSGADLVDACDATVAAAPEAGPRGCRTAQAFTWGSGTACRHAGGPEDVCARLDGRVVSEAEMAAYESSWVHRALALQRALDDAAPLYESLVPHTHNSFNSAAYVPTLSGSDPNQQVSLRDQLRLDMRMLELDVHWAPSAEGDPAHGGNAPILCHGEPVPAGPAAVHAGCTVERHLRDGLAEIRVWLDEPANAAEVVLLYLENALDDDPAAHEAAATAIDEVLGDLVLRPPAGSPCAPVPVDMSRAAMRTRGDRVLIVGNCGPGSWGTWAHERAVGERWEESGSDAGDDYPARPDCLAERDRPGGERLLLRHYEDSTWLSAMAGAGGEVTVTETERMVQCGVNLPGFDQLHPDDPRLAALVWSWAPSEPAGGAGCAAQGADARFRARDCRRPRAFACAGGAAGAWSVTRVRAAWETGSSVCTREFAGSRFAAPANGAQNLDLAAVGRKAGTEVWVAYADTDGDGRWRVA